MLEISRNFIDNFELEQPRLEVAPAILILATFPPVILNFDLWLQPANLDDVKLDQRAKYLAQMSSISEVIIQTVDTQTNRPIVLPGDNSAHSRTDKHINYNWTLGRK